MSRISVSTSAAERALERVFSMWGTCMSFTPGRTILSQGDRRTHTYRVLRGCVRSCVYSESGDRTILQFLGPGDILGLGDTRELSVTSEAVDHVVLEAMPAGTFDSIVRTDAEAAAEVREYLGAQIAAHAALIVLTAQSTAVERVRSFLRSYADRRSASGFVALPMGRRDIADHLGLSMETVSRSISTLRATGDIELKGSAFFRMTEDQAAEPEMYHAA